MFRCGCVIVFVSPESFRCPHVEEIDILGIHRKYKCRVCCERSLLNKSTKSRRLKIFLRSWPFPGSSDGTPQAHWSSHNYHRWKMERAMTDVKFLSNSQSSVANVTWYQPSPASRMNSREGRAIYASHGTVHENNDPVLFNGCVDCENVPAAPHWKARNCGKGSWFQLQLPDPWAIFFAGHSLGILLGWVPYFLILALLGITSAHRGCVHRGEGQQFRLLDAKSAILVSIAPKCCILLNSPCNKYCSYRRTLSIPCTDVIKALKHSSTTKIFRPSAIWPRFWWMTMEMCCWPAGGIDGAQVLSRQLE